MRGGAIRARGYESYESFEIEGYQQVINKVQDARFKMQVINKVPDRPM